METALALMFYVTREYSQQPETQQHTLSQWLGPMRPPVWLPMPICEKEVRLLQGVQIWALEQLAQLFIRTSYALSRLTRSGKPLEDGFGGLQHNG